MDVLFFILAAVVLGAVGQLTLKIGMGNIGQVDMISLENLFRMFTNPVIIAGLTVYVVGTVFWLMALSKKELSYVYPFLAITIILVMILSKFILHETMGVYRIAGIAVIICGILLVSRS